MHSPRTVGKVVAAIMLAAVVAPAPGQEVTLEPVADNTLYESPGGFLSNGKGLGFFSGVDAGGGLKRGLLRFDLSEIPPGSVVLEADLTLTMNRAITGPHIVELHRALAAWGEGESRAPGEEGRGAPSAPGDATWIHTFFDDMFWEAMGGDFDPAVSASAEVAEAIGASVWEGAGLLADVQRWVDDPASNHGWVVKHEDEVTLASAKRFVTREGPAEQRPMLRIVYEAAGECYADCDGSEELDFFDFLCFQNLFAAQDPEADCDDSGGLDFFDFLCFQNAFAVGC